MSEKKNSDAKPSFVPDYRIAVLSGMGILGFIVGCLFLFYDDIFCKNDSIFHEIKYQPRAYVLPLIDKGIDSLNNEIKKNKEEIIKYGDTKVADSLRKKELLVKKNIDDTAIIKQLSIHKQYCEDVADVDTLGFKWLNNSLHFQITPDSINKWDRAFDSVGYDWKSGTVNYYLKDAKIPFRLQGAVVFKPEKSKKDIAFIIKYPATGIWLILILIFCSFCFIAISTAIHLEKKIVLIFSEDNKWEISKKSYYWICAFTALVMVLMALIWNRSFYDDDIVKDLFFMKHLNVSMTWVIVLGSLSGAFCLAGFIHTASMLSCFAKPLIKIRKEVDEQKLVVQKEQPNNLNQNAVAVNPSTEQLVLDHKETEQKKQEAFFNKLAKIFQTYFILAAIILSLMVLCTGALFSTINSLDFIKLLADDWGYSPTRGDFVYLYGGLYTIILLLVYIPAKMRFSEVDIWAKPTTTPVNAKWYDFLKNPFGQIKDVLIATSPLLVSIIQSLLDILFK